MKNLIPAFIFLFLTIPCLAGVIYVDDDGPADFNNIQAAIDDSNAGDEIIVAVGTYVENINLNGKNITLISTDPNDPNVVATTIIDGNDINSVVTFNSSEDANCVLSGITIINGYAFGDFGTGGGIYCEGSSPNISNCIISGNFARFGGGMFTDDSNPTLTNCTFSDNSAGEYGAGGGMFNFDSNSMLTNCTFSGNEGGMCNVDSNSTLTNCTFSGNSAGGSAGMYNYNSNSTLLNCTFSGNLATDVEMAYGGGMTNSEKSETNLMNCTFSGNFALVGGGMFNDDSNSTLTNCTFSGNFAEWRGGGMANDYYSSSTLTNCTFAENSAMQGNALACDSFEQSYPGTVQLANCILWDGGDEIWNNDGSTIIITYSDIQGGDPCFYDPCDMIEWGVGNIDADPCFVEPGRWVDVNDPNIIVEPNDPNAFWIDGDYHLKSEGWRWDSVRQRWDYDDVTSRCIDAGNPGSPFRDEPMSVPDDPCNIWGLNKRINMGAYGGTAEASMPPYDWTLLADITNDGTVDFVDFVHFADIFGDQDDELPGDFDRDGDVDLADLDWLTYDWLLQTIWYEP